MSKTVDTRELEALSRDLKRLSRDVGDVDAVEIYCESTADRSGAENVEILDRQRANGRDPLFLSSGEHSEVAVMLQKVVADGIWFGRNTMRKTATAIGKLFVGWILAHIDSGKSERGGMRPLSKETADRKQKKYGPRPILVATGQLRGSLGSRVR